MIHKIDGPDFDMVRKIFLEEQYINTSDVEQSAIYVPRENYLNLDSLLNVVNGFFELSFLEQTAYLKVLPQILSTLTMAHLHLLFEKVYNTSVSNAFIKERFDLYMLLLDNAPVVIGFLQASRFLRSTRNTLAKGQKNVSVNPPLRSSGVFSNEIDEKFKMQVYELIEKMLECHNYDKQTRLTETIGKLSDVLSQFENDNKLLFVIISVLHETSDIKNTLIGLGLIERIAKNCSPAFLEGFVAMDIKSLLAGPDSTITRAAYLCFMSVLQMYKADFLQKKFAEDIERMASHKEPEIRIIFVDNIQNITDKMSFEFTKEKLVPVYSQLLSSKYRILKEQAMINLSKFIISILQKLLKVFNPNIDVLSEIFKHYFNLHMFTQGLERRTRLRIINQNYNDLSKIMKLFGKKLWPYLKYLMTTIEDYADPPIIEGVKLAIARQVGELAGVLGQEIVEKEFIMLIDQKFLTLAPKTSQMVKLRTIEKLASVLKTASPKIRKFFVDYYISLQDDTKKWRIRGSIISQLEDLIRIFEPEDVLSFIVPMFFVFCKDECAVVRKMTAAKFSVIIAPLKAQNVPHLFIAFENMKSFASQSIFHYRQSFIAMYESLHLKCRDAIDQEMRKLMQALIMDRVVGVQIRLAVFVASAFENNVVDDLVLSLFKELQQIPVLDIQNILRQIGKRRDSVDSENIENTEGEESDD